MKRKLLTIAIIIISVLAIGTIKSNAGSQSLNNLDFQVQINSDGSMDVTETWDIDVSYTNTLYKSFKKDKSKYSAIKNVNVIETTDGEIKSFYKTNEWAYHVQKDCYYGTDNEDGDFEIGWGVALDNSSARRKFEISYTVEDAIAKYNDYSELYWQFIGKDFKINSRKITGTIYLPSSANSKEEIKVWGHTEGLNGTIYVTDTNKIEFEIDNFINGRYVEIRSLFPTEMIEMTKRTKNKQILGEVIKEETKWAEEANARRQRQEWIEENIGKAIFIGWLIINMLTVVFFGKKIKKHNNKLKELEKYEPTQKFEYFRELPNEKTTPGEAVRIMNPEMTNYTATTFGKVFSATMLNLMLKEYIEIVQDENQKNKKDKIIIKIKNEDFTNLKEEEKEIIKFIKKATKNKEVKLGELEKYIKNHSTTIPGFVSNNYDAVKKQLIKDEKLNEKGMKEYENYTGIMITYWVFAIFAIAFSMFTLIIPAIIFMINGILCSKISKKINILTQRGVDEKEQWQGLEKYMKDFSLLNEKEVPELVIWEKYLVYATAFGIADKVIKQLKIVYPNFEEITNNVSTYTYMNLAMTTDFSSNFSNAISSSMSSAYSSGSGSGGGFSGGGGGGRRPEAAVAEDKTAI